MRTRPLIIALFYSTVMASAQYQIPVPNDYIPDRVEGRNYYDYLDESLPVSDTSGWASIVKETDFSDLVTEDAEEKEEPAAVENNRSSSNSSSYRSPRRSGSWNAGGFIRIFLVLLAIGLLIFVILSLRGETNIFKGDRKIRRKSGNITLREIEDNLESIDLRTPIQRAVDQQDFRLAVRLYYLKCIQSLSDKRIIRWKRDKTNGEYLREMPPGELRARFAELTLVFERLWYGEQALNDAQFQRVQRMFDAFLQQTKAQQTAKKEAAL